MAFDPDEYLRGSAPTPSVKETPEVSDTKAAPVSGFDPDAYLKSVGASVAPTQPGAAPSGFDPDAYLAGKTQSTKPSILAGTTLPADAGPMGNRMIEEVGVAPIPELKGLPMLDASKMSTAEERAKAQFGITPEMSMAEKALRTVKSGAYAASTGLEQTWLGGARLISDLTGVNKDEIKSISGQLAKETGAVGETFKDEYGLNIARNVGASVLQNIPLIGVGLMSGAPAVYTTMFGQSFLQNYDDSRNEGLDVGASTARSALFGAAEVLGERLGLPDLLKGFKDAAKGVPTVDLAKTFAKYMLKEQPGEQITYALQFLTDKAFDLNTEAGWNEFAQGAMDTALVTAGQTVTMGGAGITTNSILKQLRKYHSAGKEAAPKAAETPTEAPKTAAEAPVPPTEPTAPEVVPEAPTAVAPQEPLPIPETRIPEPPEARVAPSTYQDEAAIAKELAGIKTEPIELPPVAKAATTVASAATPTATATAPVAQQEFENIARPQIQTPQFQQWFGESKVKDETGKPLVVYHGTKSDKQISKFKMPSYFTDNPDFASGFGEQATYPVYISMQNPYEIDGEASGRHFEWSKKDIQELKDAGYDGVMIKHPDGNVYTPFDQTQIKSATGNKGTFSPTEPSIIENVEPRYIAPAAFATQMERAPSLRTELKRLNKMFKEGRISADIMANQAGRLLEQTKKGKEAKPRLRGQNIILSKLNDAARRKELTQEGVDLASWFISKNPSLVEDLAISIRKPGETTPSGRYTPINRLVTLFKQSGQTDTATHEILHHTERLMPADVQAAIRDLWFKRFVKAAGIADKSTDENLKRYFQDVLDYHVDDNQQAGEHAKQLISQGLVDIDNYQYFTPSEFWAVNATNIVEGRFEGSKGFIPKLKQWLKEFASKVKSAFGLTSDAPIIRALDSLAKSDGEYQSDNMITAGTRFENVEPKKVKVDRKNYKGDPAPLATWAQEPENKYITDSFIYKLQDRLIDTKRVMEAIKKQVGDISAKWDPYKREILYHGRASDAVKKFLRYDVQSLVQSIDKMGLTMPEVKEYLHNRHAQERNENVARINPSLPDGGSGIMTADAQKYLKSLPAEKRKKFEAVGKKVDEIIKKTQQILVDTGQETQETIDNWNKAYKHYVPLFREDLDYVDTGARGTGQGFSIRGAFTKRAMGSTKPVEDILSNVITSYERAVGRGEKNLVLQSLYGLAVQNPNPDFWMPINPDAVKSTKAAKLELAKMGISPTDVENLLREPMESYIDPKTGLVGQRLKQSIRDSNYALPLRIEGKQRFVIFNPNNEEAKRMVSALKNMDLRDIHAAFNFFSKFTRWFVGVNTQYNPLFGMVNFLRDVQGSAINLSTTPLAGKQAAVMKGAFANVKDVYKALRAETKGEVIDTPVGRDFAEMQAYGGQTGYRDAYQQKTEQHKIIEDTLARMNAGPAKKGLMYSLEMLSDVNDAMENATRLSVYQEAIKQGLSKDEAAILAKTISVNFNKRGAYTQEASALWGFFNSSVQGTTRTLETLRGPMGKKIIAGGISLGVIQALALAIAGFDDDQPPPFVRDKNIVIPIPGTDKKYITWPMPLGLNVLPNIGRIVTEIMLNGGKDAGKKLTHLLTAIVDSFNPFGGSESFAQLISPTAFDPVIALAENKDAFGRPIYKKDKETAPSPGHTRARDAASSFSKQMSKFLNYMSGGNEDRKGAISPTPDQIDYVIGQVTGGIGRELMKIDQSMRSLGSGEELPPYKIPVLGRFYGDAAGQAAQSGTFYNNVTELSQFEREIKGRIERKEGAESVYRDHPEARLWRKANRLENEISDLNKRKRELTAKNAPAAEIKRIEERKKVIMQNFNKEYEAAKK